MNTNVQLKDRWWRLNNLYFITDINGQMIRFRPETREVQTELYYNLWYLNEILKSRQHGITTFFCIYFLDACLFSSNIRAGIIAHSLVDAQSFFQDKVKFAYDNLDQTEIGRGIKALRPTIGDSRRELHFANNSALRVGTSLRSSTLQYLLVSEYGKICAKYPEKAKEIRTGAFNTIHPGQFIAVESTAEGMEGDFYVMDKDARDLKRTGEPLTRLDFKHFFFGWTRKTEDRLTPAEAENTVIPTEMQEYFQDLESKHGVTTDSPQRAWYIKKYKTQQDEMKREYPSTADEAFESAVTGAYYAKQMAKARKEGRICDVPYNSAVLVHTAWDLGISKEDAMTVWFFQRNGSWIDIINYYENYGEGLDHYKIYMDDLGYVYGTHFAPHDIKKRDLISGRTRIERAKDLNIEFARIDRAANITEDINEVRRMFYRFRFDEENCTRPRGNQSVGIGSLDAYRKEWNEKLGAFRRTPLHNWACHGADGMRTLVHGVLNSEPIPVDDSQGMKIPANQNRPGASGWMAQ